LQDPDFSSRVAPTAYHHWRHLRRATSWPGLCAAY
jgi:hypothetical protein